MSASFISTIQTYIKEINLTLHKPSYNEIISSYYNIHMGLVPHVLLFILFFYETFAIRTVKNLTRILRKFSERFCVYHSFVFYH